MKVYIRAAVLDANDIPMDEMIALAKDHTTSSRTLEALYYSDANCAAGQGRSDLSTYIAENPNTPHDVLHDLVIFGDVYVKTAVAKNTNAPEDILNLLLSIVFRNSRDYGSVKYHMAQNPSISEGIMEQLTNDYNSDTRYGLILRKSLPVSIMRILANDPDPDIRSELADRSDLPEDIIRDMMTDEADMVRWSLATNSATPADVIDSFADDPDFRVRWDVARNPKVSSEVLWKLSSDEHEKVREYAFKALRERGEI